MHVDVIHGSIVIEVLEGERASMFFDFCFLEEDLLGHMTLVAA